MAAGSLQNFMSFLGNSRRRKRFERRLQEFDDNAQDILSRVHSFTMLSPRRVFALIEAARYVNRYGIPGAVAECGVWRGGGVMAMAMTFDQLGVGDRTFYLYDTFTGMTEPTDKDKSISGKADAREHFRVTQTGPDSSDWCRASLDEVVRNLADTGYDRERFVTVQGKVEETIPGTVPEQIAILHLDTDWYESTRHEMRHLFPRLAPQGVLIVDDYHHWSGNRQAVDEYLATADVPILLTKVDSSVVGVRP